MKQERDKKTNQQKTGRDRQKNKEKRSILSSTRVLSLALCICCMLSLSGCGKVIFVTGMGWNQLFTIGDQSGSQKEFNVYFVTLQNLYKQTYGEDVFTREGNDTVAESLKEYALELLVKVKVLNGMAEENGISLDESELALAEQASSLYWDELTKEDIEYLDVEKTLIQQMYEEYALAVKTAESLIEGVDTEISDDDARTVTVQSILIRTYDIDEEGNRVEFSEEEKQEAKEYAQEIRDEIQYGMDNYLGITFAEYIAEYNEDSVSTYTFGKGEVDSAFEEAAFNQQIGTISDVIETEDGYRIIKTIALSDDEEIEANKEILVQEKIETAYESIYNAYVQELDYNLNKNRWAQIELCSEEEVTTSNFFAVYEQVFGES